MILNMTVKTPIPHLYIDYIEVKTADGKTLSLNWDSSEYVHYKSDFEAKFKGVCFGEDYANGRLNELKGFTVATVGIYYDPVYTGDVDLTIIDMTFEDGEDAYRPSFLPYRLPAECMDYTG